MAAKGKPLMAALQVAQGHGRMRPVRDGADEALPATRAGRYRDPDFKTLSVYIPRALHTRVKVAAAEDAREMSGLVEAVLEQWLKARTAKR